MPETTWLHRLTDESNLWLMASLSEDSRRFADAADYYIRDATQCVKKNYLIQAALSCSCAASCLEKLGYAEFADQLYAEAASIHVDNAIRVIGVSIRERLWSLERAHVFFLLAHEVQSANAVHGKKQSLERGDPFIDFGGIVAHSSTDAYQSIKSMEGGHPMGTAWILNSIADFLAARRIQTGRMRRLGTGHNFGRVSER